MPHETMSWKATDGSLHTSWEEAAAVEATMQIYTLLPSDLPSREHTAALMAHRMMIEKDPAFMTAFANLIAIMETQPAPPKPKLVIDNTKTPRRSWMADLLARAGTMNGLPSTVGAGTQRSGSEK